MNPTAEWYERFAAESSAAGSWGSAIYAEWAHGVAIDPELLALIEGLPRPKRQPVLVFAVSRLLGAPTGTFAEWRQWLLGNWPAVAAAALQRSTQANEPGRCAALLVPLGQIDGPIALLEVGASAGLCLYPDRYSYDFDGHRLDPADGPSTVLLGCEAHGAPPLPRVLPRIVWRAGIDLRPLDVADPDDLSWLQTLTGPEQERRRERIRAAAAIARAEPPLLVAGDAVDDLAALAATAPAGATLVVVSAGVLVYLSAARRERFVEAVTALDARWISLEALAVLGSTREALADVVPPAPGLFALAVDGRPVAWAAPHGQSLHWLPDGHRAPAR